jgi:hypothetical protein
MASAPTPKPPRKELTALDRLESASERLKALGTPLATTRGGAAVQKTTVSYATADGSAVAPADYKAPAGAQAFPAGQTPPTGTANVHSGKGGLLGGPHATISAAPPPPPPELRAATPGSFTPRPTVEELKEKCRDPKETKPWQVSACEINAEHGMPTWEIAKPEMDHEVE